MQRVLIVDEDKEVIGRAIKWIHVSRKMRVIDFIEGVSSKQTYNKMSKGNAVRGDEIYLKFLDKLQLTYNYEDSTMIYIHNQIDHLYQYFDACNEQKAKECLEDCLQLLSQYKNCIIEYIYYEALSLVYDYLYAPDKQLEKALHLKKIIHLYSYPLQQILLDYIFRITWNSRIKPRSFFNELFHDFPYEESKFNSNRINFITHLLQNNKIYEAISELSTLIHDLKKDNNVNLLLQCYVLKLKMVSYIQPKSVKEMTEEVFELIEENKESINQDVLMNFYHNVGIYLCYNEHYEQAALMMKKTILLKRYYYRSAVVLFYIERVSGVAFDHTLLTDQGRKEEGPDVLGLYYYYRHNEEMAYEEKITHLHNIVRKFYLGVGESNLFYVISRDELMVAFDEEIRSNPKNKDSVIMRKYNYQRRLKAIAEHELDKDENNETK